MYLALRDLRFARGRFLLTGTVVALIAVLGVLLSGMSTGLTDSGVSGLRALPVSGFAFSADASGELFSRSSVTRAQWEHWAATPGVEAAAPFGDVLAHASVNGGDGGRGDNGVLVSRQVLDQGVRIGDRLSVERSGVVLTVVGSVGDESYGHVPTAYAPLDVWQRIQYGLPGNLPQAARDVATAVAVRTKDGFSARAPRTSPPGRTG